MSKEIQALFGRDAVKSKFQELLGKRSSAFITSVLQAVSSNSHLQQADPTSIYQAAAISATLNLPINPNLGLACIVPYKEKGVQVAQFQIMRDGWVELAHRSGQYKKLHADDIRQGEIKSYDRERDEYVFEWEQDEAKRDKLPIIAYFAYLQLHSGFEKRIVMYVDKLNAHGKRYSKTFTYETSKWKTDFEAMALKTVLKKLIKKWGPKSTEIETALIVDQSVIKDHATMDVDYVDADKDTPEAILNKITEVFEEVGEQLTEDEQKDALRIIDKQETASYDKLLALLNSKKR